MLSVKRRMDSVKQADGSFGARRVLKGGEHLLKYVGFSAKVGLCALGNYCPEGFSWFQAGVLAPLQRHNPFIGPRRGYNSFGRGSGVKSYPVSPEFFVSNLSGSGCCSQHKSIRCSPQRDLKMPRGPSRNTGKK